MVDWGTDARRAFLYAGATVVGTSRTIQQSDFDHPNFTALQAEISSLRAPKSPVDQVIVRFGRFDVLAHTVGGFAGGQSIVETDNEVFQRMFDLNLNCGFHILRAVIPPLRNTGNGPHHCDRKPSRCGTCCRCGSLQRFEAAMVSLIRTVALENKDTGLTANVIPRHNGYPGEPQRDSECGCEQVG